MSNVTGGNVLVVDDDINSLKMVEQFLNLKNFEVTCSLTYRDAKREMADGKFVAAVLDYFMPDTTGLVMMKEFREIDPDLPVIILTAARDIKLAVQAIKEGALSYQVKPVDPDELYSNLQTAINTKSLVTENRRLQFDLSTRYKFDSIIGSSGRMMDVYDMTHRASKVRSTVLVTGETGCGKELIAKAIHYNSDRAKKPFISVNCAAVPESLLESELFGIEKNVASGVDARAGKFEAADGGTLFLDEIGDMSILTQAKVLRAIQEREIERVGSHTPRKIDIRIVAATHRNLEQAISDGKFRRDLYYRLNVLVIALPQLKDRKEDLPELCEHFIAKYCDENRLPEKRLSNSAFGKLRAYPWPGNVRELENTMERAVVICDDEKIDVAHLPLNIRSHSGAYFSMPDEPTGGLEESVAEFEKEFILTALKRNGYKQNKTAEDLKVSERSIWYKIKKHGIDTKHPTPEPE